MPSPQFMLLSPPPAGSADPSSPHTNTNMRIQFDGKGLNDTQDPHKARVATLRPEYLGAGTGIARAVNACHGLDLPEGLPPGILADAIQALRALQEWVEDNAPEPGDPDGEWCDQLKASRFVLASLNTD